MKSLKFAPQLVPLILKGEKTITWRLFDDKNLQEGDLVHFLNSGTTKEFATAKLIKVVSKKMREVDDEDFDGHEKFTSQEQMYETYSNYYNKQITPETVVKVVKFKLL